MNLGQSEAQRPRFAITERLLAIGAAATSTLLGMHRPAPPIWGSRGRLRREARAHRGRGRFSTTLFMTSVELRRWTPGRVARRLS